MNRIQFYRTQSSPSLAEYIGHSAKLSKDAVIDLMALGAVYLENDRVLHDRPVESGQLVRFHSEPKRYPHALTDWRKQIVFEHSDFLVINKPAEVPIHATLDNHVENALTQLSILRGEKLYPAHRLDISTSGLCVVGRKAQFQKEFHKILKVGGTQKVYQALCTAKVQLGLYEHFMQKQKRPPHLMFEVAAPARKLCRLEVLNCVAQAEGYLCEVLLLTGRTHQIRAQLAHLGSPLVGDTLYGAVKSQHYYLHSARLKFVYEGEKFDFKL